MFRPWRRAQVSNKSKSRASRQRTNLSLKMLEERVVPTTDLILDFDGGTLQSNQGYIFPSGFGTGIGGNTMAAWTGFDSSNPPSPEVRTAQILQILAGVREDYADFDVRVIWDDRGVESPLYDGVDTVIMIVGDPNAGLFGIASSVDITQVNRDVGLTFGPTHEDLFPDTMARSIREIIDTVSHEAGHTFGLSHATQADSEQRQLVTTAPQNTTLDSRFSTEELIHGGPEPGGIYSERDRLQQTLGLALPGTTLISNETATSQTLQADTFVTGLPSPTSLISINGAIDFAGDRDAYRIQIGQGGSYTIRQRSLTTAVAPVITLWSQTGDFIATGSIGDVGGFSEVTFTATPGQVVYVVAGTAFDQLPSAVIGTPTIGTYVVETGEFTPPPPPTPPLIGSLVTGVDSGGLPLVRVIDVNTGAVIRELIAYDSRFRGGVRVAYADVNGDGISDIITAPGSTGGPHIRVFSGANFQQLLSPIGSFMAYSPAFFGGIYVAAADFNGDGRADIVTGAGTGGGPHVRVFDAATGGLLTEFMAYDQAFRGGITVATGDVNGDTRMDIITGAGPGGGPHVQAFDAATHAVIVSIFAYSFNFRGGVFVSAGDTNGDGRAEIFTGAGAGGQSHVRVFDGTTGNGLASFFAFTAQAGTQLFVGDTNYNGGVRIIARDITGDGNVEIMAVPGSGGRPTVRYFNFAGTPLGSADLFDPLFLGGVFVG